MSSPNYLNKNTKEDDSVPKTSHIDLLQFREQLTNWSHFQEIERIKKEMVKVAQNGETHITIVVNNKVLESFREAGFEIYKADETHHIISWDDCY